MKRNYTFIDANKEAWHGIYKQGYICYIKYKTLYCNQLFTIINWDKKEYTN